MTEIELLRKQNTEWARKLGNAQAIRNALAVLVRVCLSLDAAHDPETGLYYAVKQAQEALGRAEGGGDNDRT